jgi:hypothetical protein
MLIDPPTLTSPQLSRLAYPATAQNPPSQLSRLAYPATAQNPPSQLSRLAYPANLFY